MENNELIRRAVSYAKQNATCTKISVQDIATNAGFSMDYFNRIFLAHTGFSVMSYVNYIRLKKAIILLRNTDKSLLDIALEIGYDSHEGFTKAFKKKYNITPSEYRGKMKSKVLHWGELTDESIAAQFIYSNPTFRLVDTDAVIDYLLERDAKRYGYLCATIKYMGFAIAASDGNFQQGFLCVGDDRKNGYYLEAVTDDFEVLAKWISAFPNVTNFYSASNPAETSEALKQYGFVGNINAIPQSVYVGISDKLQLPESLQIRPLTVDDRDVVLKWANGKRDGYIAHLLTAQHYLDEAVLEYGVFENGELIAVAGCGIDEVQGFRLNDCCQIRFAEGKACDELYRSIYSFVANDILSKGILPFDNLQHGEYAEAHGNFTAVELGYEVVNWMYEITSS